MKLTLPFPEQFLRSITVTNCWLYKSELSSVIFYKRNKKEGISSGRKNKSTSPCIISINTSIHTLLIWVSIQLVPNWDQVSVVGVQIVIRRINALSRNWLDLQSVVIRWLSNSTRTSFFITVILRTLYSITLRVWEHFQPKKIEGHYSRKLDSMNFLWCKNHLSLLVFSFSLSIFFSFLSFISLFLFYLSTVIFL